MNSHTVTTRKGFPVTAVAIALALAVVISILAVQGMALVTSHTTHPAVVQQGSSDLGSAWVLHSPCGVKSSRTPRHCFSGGAGREKAKTKTRDLSGLPTLRQISAHKA